MLSTTPTPFADIQIGTESSDPSEFVAIGDTVFFIAETKGTGREVWKTDGTSAGTTILKDIVPGVGGSAPSQLTKVGNTLYFIATGSWGTELWKSDGTRDGTVCLDIRTGSQGSYPANLSAVGTTLYFTADDGKRGYELWKSDGTFDGTEIVRDIDPGELGGYPSLITAVGNTVLFANNQQLWKTDGTAAGTSFVRSIWARESMCRVGNSVLFIGDTSATGQELWKSDGTIEGTALVKDINAGPSWALNYNQIMSTGSTAYFAADDGVNGMELWKSDGTAAGTVLIRDIEIGSAGSVPSDFVQVGKTLYFTATGSQGRELWKSDGTAAGTVLVKDIVPGSDGSRPSGLTKVGETLYFTATGSQGRELWKSDGTRDGTVCLEIRPGSLGSDPGSLTAIGDTLIFSANDGNQGREMWYVRDGAAFTSQRKIGSVEFGTTPAGYALRVGGVLGTVMPVMFAGANVSAVPTSGWVALGARQGEGGYELLWRNTQTGVFAAWTLNKAGAYTTGRSLSLPEVHAIEAQVEFDVSGDGKVGALGQFVSQRTAGIVEFGSIPAGYALRVNGTTIIPVSFSGENSSASRPGAGWAAVGAWEGVNGYELLWRNAQTGTFANWTLSKLGAYVSGQSRSLPEVQAAEAQVGFDMSGDGLVGVRGPFTSQTTVGIVEFGTVAAGYALRLRGTSVMPVSFGGANASASRPGAGWVAVGARESVNGYELLWRKAREGIFASWTLDKLGALVSGQVLSLPEIQAVESQAKFDIDGDGIAGVAVQSFTQLQWASISETSGEILEFGTIPTGYALQLGGNTVPPEQYVVIPVSFEGANASVSRPGSGWEARAVLPSGRGWSGWGAQLGRPGDTFELIWRNVNTSAYMGWTLSVLGARTGAGRVLSLAEVQARETKANFDITGDGKIGVPTVTFTSQQTVGAVEFGTNAAGYALRVGGANGNVIPVTIGGANASASRPGAGWVALGARESSNGYELFWRNTQTGVMRAWTLNGSGAFTGDQLLSLPQVQAVEAQVNIDVNGDRQVGVPENSFTQQTTVDWVRFGTIPAGYALMVGWNKVIPVTFGSAYVSAAQSGAGWVALGARLSINGYELFWRNAQAGTFAAWKLNDIGSYTGSQSLSLPEVQAIEAQVGFDITGDGKIGTPGPFTVQQQLGAVEFGTVPAGYAMRIGGSSGRVIPVSFGGAVASPARPGSGWVALGARHTGSGYQLLWRNQGSGTYASWELSDLGGLTNGVGVSLVDVQLIETLVNVDITGDGKIGSA